MTVYFEDEAMLTFEFDLERQLEQIISFVRDHVNCPYDLEVSVTMVDKATIQEVNARFQSGYSGERQIFLREVTRYDDFGPKTDTCQKHFHLRRRRVLRV